MARSWELPSKEFQDAVFPVNFKGYGNTLHITALFIHMAKKKIIIDTRKSSVLLFLYIPSHFKRKIIIITKFRLFYFDTIFFFSFPRKNSKDIHNLFLFSLIFSISLIISNRHCNWLPNCPKRYFPSSRRNTLRNNVRYLFQQIHFPRIASTYVYIHTCIPSISKRRKNISSKLKNRPFVPR